MNTYDLLTKIHEGRVCRVTLNRPDVHNAFNAQLIAELRSAFEEIEGQVLAGGRAGSGISGCG